MLFSVNYTILVVHSLKVFEMLRNFFHHRYRFLSRKCLLSYRNQVNYLSEKFGAFAVI